jgi:hypothetical protein
MLFAVFSWTCALVTLAAFLYRLPALLSSPKNIALAALCAYFLCNSLAYFVDLEIFRRQVTDFLSFPNSTTIIVQVLVITLTAAQQISVVNLALPPKAAKRSTLWLAVGFGVSMAILTIFFVIVHPDKQGTAPQAVYLNLQDNDYALYFTYYLTICAAGRLQTVIFAFRHARKTPDFWLRLGLWFVAGGSALILIYCGVRYWQIIALHTTCVVEPWKFLFWLIADTGTLLQTFGWTVPSWGPKLGAIRRWLNSYHDYRRLDPLWRALYGTVPGIALENPPSRLLAWIPPRPLDYHLYRRVIEIRDAELILRQAADPAAWRSPDRAKGARPERLGEAAVLRSTLQAGRGGPRSTGASQHDESTVRRTPGDGLRQEIAALTQMSQTFQTLRRTQAKKRSDQDDGLRV